MRTGAGSADGGLGPSPRSRRSTGRLRSSAAGVDSIGVELIAEITPYGEVLLDTGGRAAEGPITYERDTFTATDWPLFDGTGTASWQVVVGMRARQYFVGDPAVTSGKYKVREHDAAGTLAYKGTTSAMEGCTVVVYPKLEAPRPKSDIPTMAGPPIQLEAGSRTFAGGDEDRTFGYDEAEFRPAVGIDRTEWFTCKATPPHESAEDHE